MNRYYQYKMKTFAMNVYAILIFLIIYIGVLLTYENYEVVFDGMTFIYLIAWFILHELLHYVGFLCSKKVKPKDLQLGMCLEKGIFYCMCKKQINKRDILVALLFPLTFIGIVTLIIGYIFKSPLLILLSVVNISGAIGDILMTIQILRMPNTIKYTDVDDCAGYYLITTEDISNIKTSGLKLFSTGEYEKEKFIAKDKRKVVISKISMIVLLIILIYSILSLAGVL